MSSVLTRPAEGRDPHRVLPAFPSAPDDRGDDRARADPDDLRHRPGLRDPAPAGGGGDRRAGDRDPADPAGPPDHLLLVELEGRV